MDNTRYKFRAWDGTNLKYLTNPAVNFNDGSVITQWTGLKDKTGADIFEGDVVEAWSQGSCCVFEVRWRSEGSPCFFLFPAFQNGEMWYLHGFEDKRAGAKTKGDRIDTGIKVLGNTFLNPELVSWWDDGTRKALFDRLVKEIGQARFNFNSEDDLQAGIARLLSNLWRVEREVELSAADRIDFMVSGIGIEVKVDGSRADVARQLHRYAQSNRVKALILVTNRTRHSDLPAEINGKPLKVLSLVLRSAF